MDITAAGHTALFNDFVAATREKCPLQVDDRAGRQAVAVEDGAVHEAAGKLDEMMRPISGKKQAHTRRRA